MTSRKAAGGEGLLYDMKGQNDQHRCCVGGGSRCRSCRSAQANGGRHSLPRRVSLLRPRPVLVDSLLGGGPGYPGGPSTIAPRSPKRSSAVASAGEACSSLSSQAIPRRERAPGLSRSCSDAVSRRKRSDPKPPNQLHPPQRYCWHCARRRSRCTLTLTRLAGKHCYSLRS